MTPFQTIFILIEFCIVFGMMWAIASMTMSLFHGAPFVPSESKDFKKALSEIGLKKGQHFLELGSGDGRVVCEAVKTYGVVGRGVEISHLWILLSRIRARVLGIGESVQFQHGNIKKADLGWADIVYLYMMPRFLEEHADTILKTAKAGTLIASHGFKLPNKEPSKVVEAKVPTYVYRVP